MNYDKYLDDLNYEDADTVLGSVMSAAGFPKIDNIEDACDVAYLSGNESDRKIIEQHQPMFYNTLEHRLVNKQDVINIINQLNTNKKWNQKMISLFIWYGFNFISISDNLSVVDS